MTITIGDVAQAAGVSTATVSPLSRDYVISPSASRLPSGRTGSIGVITPRLMMGKCRRLIAFGCGAGRPDKIALDR